MKTVYSEIEIKLQRELDAARRDKLWDELALAAGGGARGESIKEAFKQLYTLYKPSLSEWYAGLYDPTVGGFYSTEEGRDYESFGPDVESTAQTLAFIEQSGMLDEVGTVNDALPKKIQSSIVRFAKGIQHENGFFYGKHWNFDDIHYNLSRRGRDLSWATILLKRFGARPTYDTPNGIIGDGLDIDGNPVCKGAQSAKVAESVTKSSRGSEAKQGAYPDYLENEETFKKYLSTLDINRASYHFGNQLNATFSQIGSRAEALLAGGAKYDLREILINWLNEHIVEETGYWGEKVDMAGSNGFFKIITLYNVWGKPYPAAEKATESVLESIMGSEIAQTNCCSVFNLWSCISSIKTNVKRTATAELRDKLLGEIDEVLRERGAEAILNTYEKMLPYQRGTPFHHSYPGYNVGGTQQGLYCGFPPILGGGVGNVDATGICTTGLTRVMFESFGFKKVPLLMKADYMVFINTVSSVRTISEKKKQTTHISLENEENSKFVSVFGGASEKWSNGALEITLSDGESGAIIDKTARICKGDYHVIEAEFSLEDISSEGTLRLSVGRGLSPIATAVFVDLAIKGGKLTASSDLWSKGFSSKPCELPKSLNVRMEYHLVPSRTEEGLKYSAARIYLNGKYLGTAINDDGTDARYPSGITPNMLGGALLYSPDGLKAKIILKTVCHSHPSTEDARKDSQN